MGRSTRWSARGAGWGRAAALLAGVAACGPLGLVGCKTTEETAESRAVDAVRMYKDGVNRFTNQSDVDGGIELLQRAKRLTPDYTQLRYDLGRMLLFRAIQTDTRALIALADAERLKSESNVPAADRKVQEARALNDTARRDLSEAKGDFAYAETQVTPSQLPNVHYFQTQVYASLEDYETAREYLDRAISTAKSQNVPLTLELQEQLNRIRQQLEKAAADKKRASNTK